LGARPQRRFATGRSDLRKQPPDQLTIGLSEQATFGLPGHVLIAFGKQRHELSHNGLTGKRAEHSSGGTALAGCLIRKRVLELLQQVGLRLLAAIFRIANPVERRPNSVGIVALRLLDHVDPGVRILKVTNGRVAGPDGAAARMDIKRTTLISRMKKLGIEPRKVL